MAGSFLTDLSGKLAERWLTNLLTPAFVFWAGGLAAWAYQGGNWQKQTERVNWLMTQISPLSDPWKIALIIASLLLIAISALIVERFDLPVIRFLEGYWSRWFDPIRSWAVQQQRSRYRRYRWQFECLAKKQEEGLSPDELERYRVSYYPRWLRPFRNRLRSSSNRQLPQHQDDLSTLEHRLQELEEKRTQGGGYITALTAEEWEEYETLNHQLHNAQSRLKGLTSKEAEQYRRLDWQLKQFPSRIDRLMPTALGNILRAAETRPQDKYGLDAILCWSRLWLVLPDAVKKNLQEARSELNVGARIWLWSMLFILWGLYAWWAIPAGLLFALLTYRWMLNTASAYGDLVEAAFDLHRTQLYKSLRLPLPEDPKDELQKAHEMTIYLLGGYKQDKPKFTKPEEKGSSS
jgi:hypothetical protein